MPLVPYVIEQTGRGERMYDVYSRLLKERIIFLGTPIDSEVANVIVAQLLLLDSQSSEQEISMYINCPGGEVYAGLLELSATASLAGIGTDALDDVTRVNESLDALRGAFDELERDASASRSLLG